MPFIIHPGSAKILEVIDVKAVTKPGTDASSIGHQERRVSCKIKDPFLKQDRIYLSYDAVYDTLEHAQTAKLAQHVGAALNDINHLATILDELSETIKKMRETQ